MLLKILYKNGSTEFVENVQKISYKHNFINIIYKSSDLKQTFRDFYILEFISTFDVIAML